MTALPEARLAREAELCYACLAMVTDYDVWRHDGDVTVDLVVENLNAMTEAIGAIIPRLVKDLPDRCPLNCGTVLDAAVISAPDAISSEARERLKPITSRYFAERARR